jgi:hypothetical protein
VGPRTITPTTALPEVSQSTFIDGYSQPGAVPNTNTTDEGVNAQPMIVVDGGNLAFGSSVLRVNADSSIVRGLVIQNFPDRGIRIDGNNNKVEGNFVGTNATGRRERHGRVCGMGGANNVVGGISTTARM